MPTDKQIPVISSEIQGPAYFVGDSKNVKNKYNCK